MSRDPRSLVRFPYLAHVAARPYPYGDRLALVTLVTGEDHAAVAHRIAAGFQALAGHGVVRERSLVKGHFLKASKYRARKWVPSIGSWVPSEREAPDEAARVYAPGVGHTRLTLSIPYMPDARGNWNLALTTLGTRAQMVWAIRQIVLAAGARLREFEIFAYESLDDPRAARAYADLHRGKVMLPIVETLQDYWREPSSLDRVLATDAAVEALPQTATVRALHLELSATEFLLVRGLLRATRSPADRTKPVNLNSVEGICARGRAHFRKLDSIAPAVLNLQAGDWLRAAVRTQAGWEAARGPKLRSLTPDDLISLE